jgi:replicative DNA helicase
MSHIELEIISNIVDQRSMREAKKLGLDTGQFRTPEGKEVFTWLWEEYHKVGQLGEVPTKQRLLRKFPTFEYATSKNSIPALVEELGAVYLEKDTANIIDQLATLLEDGFDSKTIIVEALNKFRELQVESIANDGSFLHNKAAKLRDRYVARQTSGGITGIPYPYAPLNKMTGGMCNGDLVYIYGRPGMMKSWLLCVLAAEAHKAKRRTMIYTKEVADETLMERIISVLLKLDYRKYREGALSTEQSGVFFDFLDTMEDLQEDWETEYPGMFFITDQGVKKPRTVENIVAIAERVRPEILFIDGMYLLSPSERRKNMAEHERIKSISRALKNAAQQLGIPIITTSQANREGKRSISVNDTEDAAFSDAVGQDADVMLRTFKGPHPTIHGGASLMVVPKKIREGTPEPFIINAVPSADWSLQQYPANAKLFLQSMEKQEGATNGGSQGGSPFRRKHKKKTGPFRE